MNHSSGSAAARELTPWQKRYKGLSAREAFRSKLLELAQNNPRIFCLDSDMGGLEGFEKALPNQYADVGIAEANLVSMAAGLAKVGWLPILHTMANFAASRANEQIKLDIARTNLPVKIVVSHGGVSGGHLGPTHHALDDIAALRAFPNMTIIVPCDAAEAEAALAAALALPSPAYIRLGRKATALHHENGEVAFEIGKARIFEEGDDLAIFATGPSALAVARAAAGVLRQRGIGASVVNCHTIKPFDAETLLRLARSCGRIITIEEHSVSGGLGSSVAEILAQHCPCPLRMIGANDYFFGLCGDEAYLLDQLGINVEAVLRAADDLLAGMRPSLTPSYSAGNEVLT